jgi:DNA-binding CsgD family transcriptional regulator
MGHHSSITDEADGWVESIEPAVAQLLRRLIGHARPDPADDADQIILDAEVDGVRYLVVRCAPRVGPDPEAARGPTLVGARPERGPALSPREYEIARMVAKGYANKTIASVLGISSWTVSSHLRRSFSKLGVTSRAALVAQLLDDRPTQEPPASPLSDQPLATDHRMGEPAISSS